MLQEETNTETKTDDNSAQEILINDLQAQIQELKNEVLRGKADIENLRKRSEKERLEASQFGAFRFAKDLLKIVDGLDMAMTSLEQNNDVENVIKGIKMVHQEFDRLLVQHGIQKIDAIHHKFNPDYHEVVTELEDSESEHPEQTIVQVMQQGYKMYDRLLRPAMVGVKK